MGTQRRWTRMSVGMSGFRQGLVLMRLVINVINAGHFAGDRAPWQ